MIQLQRTTGATSWRDLCDADVRHQYVLEPSGNMSHAPTRPRITVKSGSSISARRLNSSFALGCAPSLKAYLFQPREAEAERRAIQRESRKTKVQPSQTNRKKKKPRKQPTDRYTTGDLPAIRQVWHRASEPRSRGARARHSYRPGIPINFATHFATRVRREHGLDAARVLLGHSSPVTSEIYAELDEAKGDRRSIARVTTADDAAGRHRGPGRLFAPYLKHPRINHVATRSDKGFGKQSDRPRTCAGSHCWHRTRGEMVVTSLLLSSSSLPVVTPPLSRPATS